jgi:hypothetical protein
MAPSINGGNLTLVRPALWEDPQEDLCAWLQMDARGGSQKQLSGYLRPTYAQCWSMDGQSDALLRAYSRVSKDSVSGRNVEPKLEGVKALQPAHPRGSQAGRARPSCALPSAKKD